jgi:hypothetical protein
MYAAFVGLDWADQQHDTCCQAAEGSVPLHGQVAQRAEDLEAWASELRSRFGGRPIALCLEQSRGAVIHALMKYEFFVLFPVNPKQFARFREAFSPGGAKANASDAELLCVFVQQHHERLRAWKPDDETTCSLRLLVEDRRLHSPYRVTGQGFDRGPVRLTGRLRAHSRSNLVAVRSCPERLRSLGIAAESAAAFVPLPPDRNLD